MAKAGGGDGSGVRQLSPSGAQLHRSLLECLNAIDRANFGQILESYKRTRNVQRLVESLNEICRTPQQREEIYPLLRAFIARNDRARFDYECYRPRSAHGRQYHTYSSKQLSKYDTTRSLPEDLPYRWNESPGLGTPPRTSSGISERRPKVKKSSTPKVVVLARDEERGEKFGFSIRGGSEHNVGIFVSSLDEGSVAESAGLCLGDQIMEGNGMEFNDLSHEQAVEVFQQATTLHLRVRSVGKIPGTFKSSSSYRWIDRSGKEVSPPAEYTKADLSMREMNKSEMRLLGGDDERKVNLFVADGAELGLTIRGGNEHGIGIFIASVDKNSGAERAGFQVGDQILDVNGKCFLDISHKEAVRVLKSALHMVVTLKDVGILPHGKQIRDETKWICDEGCAKTSPRSASADAMKKTTGTRKMPSFHEAMPGSSQLTHHSIVDHSDDILEVKARQVLTNNELHAFAFYLNEYRSTNLSLTSFLTTLSDLLGTHEKAALFEEIRSAILPRDLTKFDEWVGKSDDRVSEARHTAEGNLKNHDAQSLYSCKSSNSSTNSWFGLFKNGKHQRKKNPKDQKKDKEHPNSPKHHLNHSGKTHGRLGDLNGSQHSTTSDEFPPLPKFITDNENSWDELSTNPTNLRQELRPSSSEQTKNQSPIIERSPPFPPQVSGRTVSPSEIQYAADISDDEDTEYGLYTRVNRRDTSAGSSHDNPSNTMNERNRISKVMPSYHDETDYGLYATVNHGDIMGSTGDTLGLSDNAGSSGDAFTRDIDGSANTPLHDHVKKANKKEVIEKEFQKKAMRGNKEDQMPLYAVVDKSRTNKSNIPKEAKKTLPGEVFGLPSPVLKTELVTLYGKDRKPFHNGDFDEDATEFSHTKSTELQNENPPPEVPERRFKASGSDEKNDEPYIETSIKSFPERLREFDKRCVVDGASRNTGSKERLRKTRKSRSKIIQETRDEQREDKDNKTFVVELIKHTSNLGLSITGGTDTESKEIRIKSVKSGNTVAGSCPLLKPGQIILCVDEKSLRSVTSGIAAMAIRQAFHSDKNVLKLILEER